MRVPNVILKLLWHIALLEHHQQARENAFKDIVQSIQFALQIAVLHLLSCANPQREGGRGNGGKSLSTSASVGPLSLPSTRKPSISTMVGSQFGFVKKHGGEIPVRIVVSKVLHIESYSVKSIIKRLRKIQYKTGLSKEIKDFLSLGNPKCNTF